MTTPATLPDTPNADGAQPLATFFTSLSHSAGINKMVGDIYRAWQRMGVAAADGAELDFGLVGDANGQSLWDSLARLNEFRNGSFDHWGWGTSFSASGLTADGWRGTIGTGGSPAATMSRQAHSPGELPGEPEFYYRHQQTAQATSTPPSLEQRMVSVRRHAGRKVTISVWLRCGSGTLVVTPRVIQHFGSGGSPSSSVNTDGATITVTTTWTRFVRTITLPSISGKTVGTTARTSFTTGTLLFPINSTYTIDVSQAKNERGAVATEFVWIPPELDLYRIYRFHYWRETVGSSGTNALVMGSAVSATQARCYAPFPVEMNTVPSLTSDGTPSRYAILNSAAGFAGTVSGLATIANTRWQGHFEVTTSAGLTAGSSTALVDSGANAVALHWSCEP